MASITDTAVRAALGSPSPPPLHPSLSGAVPTQPLRLRARAASAQEMGAIPWLKAIEPELRERVSASIQVAEVEVGERICRIGREANFWFGVIDGL
ncbi:hypothetical protein FUT87_20520, partial [Mitsuaria sp. TWR114]